MITNPINKSGKELEKSVEEFLVQNNFNFKRPKSKGKNIDFIVETTEGKLHIECKNQNKGGSVDEKLPYTVYKYVKKYEINHMIIIQGKHVISKGVKDCIKEMPNVTVDFYDFYSFCRFLNGKKIMGDLESCMN